MSSTDDRIVNMQFNNETFKKKALETKTALADVNKAVDSTGKNKGLMGLDSSMQQVQVSASKMTTVVTAGIATIASKATAVGLNLVSALTLDPIRQGFSEYEALLTKQNTIMNATGLSAKHVKGVLGELNEYSDQTIYSFGNMTEAIMKFVNAGVPLDKAAESVKGVANAAAYAGASTDDANRAMFALGQSISNGFLTLGDFNQLESANMATVQFKETLLDSAVAAGTLTKSGKDYITASGEAINSTKGFQYSLQEQWATTEVLNGALGKYTDLSTELGRKATESATEVRTLTAFMDTLKESIGSGWSQIFRSLFGGLKGATSFWTGLSTAVGDVVGRFFTFTSATLRTWRALGGFEKTIQGFKNLLAPIGALFMAVGTAFKTAFPRPGKGAGNGLYQISSAFEALTRPLTWLAKGITALTPVFAFFFQIIALGIAGVKQLTGFLLDLVTGALGLVNIKAPSGGGLLGFVKNLAKAISDAVGKISDLVAKGASLTSAFGAVSFDMPDMPSMPSMPKMDMPSMPSMPDIGGMFGGGGGAEAASGIAALTSGVTGLKDSVTGLNKASDDTEKHMMFNPDAKLDTSRVSDAADAYSAAGDKMAEGGERAKTWGGALSEMFGNLKDSFLNFITGFTSEDLVKSFNMAVLATFAFTVISFIRSITNMFQSFGNIGQGVADAFTGIGDALGSFQTAAQAKLIIAIAIAIAILVVALIALSFLPAEDIAKGLITLGLAMKGFSNLMDNLTEALDNMKKDKVSAMLIATAVVIVAFALAMLILAGALLLFNFIDWGSIAKGILVMEVLRNAIESFADMGGPDTAKNMLAASVALVAMAYALGLMALALMLYKFVDWESIGKGGVVLGVMAGTLALLALLPAPSLIAVGKAMLSTAAGMVLMAGALLLFKFVQWESIGKLAVVLGALALALGFMMAVGGPVAVSGMIGLGLGMIAIATAGLMLQSVNWETIGKIAALLGIMAVALAVFGAIAYFAAPALIALGQALLMIGAGVALFGLGVAVFVAAMGAAIALGAAGAGAFALIATAAAVAIAVFLQTLAAEAPIIKDALLDILQEFINGIVEAVPMVIKGFKDLWKAVMAELGGNQKKGVMGDTGQSWISKLADGIKKKLPEIVKRGMEIIIGFIKAVTSKAGELASAAVGLVVALLKGIASKAGDLVKAGVDMVIALAKALGDNVKRLAQAAADLIVKFVRALADAVRNNSDEISAAAIDLADAFVDAFLNVLGNLKDAAMNKVGEIGGALKDKAKDIMGGLFRGGEGGELPDVTGKGKNKKFELTGMSIYNVAKMLTDQVALANEYMSAMIQNLEIAADTARGRADGLAAAAQRAAQYADKTKGEKDDKAAERMINRANKADKAADERERKAEAAKKQQDWQDQFRNATLLEKAQMLAEKARGGLEGAKAAKQRAVAARAEADALDKASKNAGLTAEQRKAMRKEAEKLRAQAKKDDQAVKDALAGSRTNAAEALKYQKLAGAEAAKSFQDQFDAQAKAAKDEAAYDKMTDVQKAAFQKSEADRLDRLSKANIKKAKEMAYTDIEAANILAQLALDQAESARQAREEAEALLAAGQDTPVTGSVVDLSMAEAAAAAAGRFMEQYLESTGAASGAPTVVLNQTNNSPEALSDTEIYRQTHNLVTHAVGYIETPAT